MTVQYSTLFSNRGKAIPEDSISGISNSLILIKVTKPTISYVKSGSGKNQLRIKFFYSDHEYDLPITDIEFEKSTSYVN